jgi:hypothetical protein
MNIDAFILSYKREKNISRVIKGIRRQSFVRNIYVIHNSPSTTKVLGARNLVFDNNFGCIARHTIALLSNCDYALFVDDDIEIQVDLSQRFQKLIKTSSFGVAGVYCRKFKEKNINFSDQVYESSIKLHHKSVYTAVDIVVGRIHFCKRELIPLMFIDPIYINYPLADDIILNFSLQMNRKLPSIGIPSKPDEFKNLDDHFAVHKRSNHYFERSHLVRHFTYNGWKSLTCLNETSSIINQLNKNYQ